MNNLGHRRRTKTALALVLGVLIVLPGLPARLAGTANTQR